MPYKFTIKELQYLDASLKILARWADNKKSLSIVIKEGNLLITGDFMTYSPGKHPLYRHFASFGVNSDELCEIEGKSLDVLFNPMKGYFPSITKETCVNAINNPDLLLEVISKENVIKSLLKDYYWEGLNKLKPYLYKPIFIGVSTEPKLSFYALDPDGEYEVVSIISSDE